MKYNVVEEFDSVQGEGLLQGTPMRFIRLGDCNLNCTFCDTKWDEWQEKDLEDIVRGITMRWVIITGGEPTLQDLKPLIERLHEWGHKVAVESNGYKMENCHGADWVCISPKGKELVLPEIGEVKLLVGGPHDALLEERIQSLCMLANVTLQPITEPDGTFIQANIDRAIALCVEYNVHYSARLHHMIGVE